MDFEERMMKIIYLKLLSEVKAWSKYVSRCRQYSNIHGRPTQIDIIYSSVKLRNSLCSCWLQVVQNMRNENPTDF
jgi:hypothetical protein